MYLYIWIIMFIWRSSLVKIPAQEQKLTLIHTRVCYFLAKVSVPEARVHFCFAKGYELLSQGL